MVLDAKLRRELVLARQNITTQLMQLESAAIDPLSLGGPPDSRDVYAELQKELREVDELLGTTRDDEASPLAYQPMATTLVPQAQGMWRFRGIGAGAAALWVLTGVTLVILSAGRPSLRNAVGFAAMISLASLAAALKDRRRELRLFLFTLAIGSGLIGLALLVAASTV
jgi:hypothetical protein